MKLPLCVEQALKRLEDAGFEAVLVGGCVRDSLLKKVPTDYDIATSAKPHEVKRVFANERTVDVGIKHGTVTVVFPERSLEITTYRVDGEYHDARRPDEVSFTGSLAEDLKRRDFTVNAMAYSGRMGLVDLYGGQEDLKNGVVRCVGDPMTRFSEDALRIMRAVRFASTLGFTVEEKTKESALALRENLKRVAAERISVEFVKMLCGRDVKRVLCEMADIVGVFVPQVLEMRGFSQQNPHHIYDVLEHTAVALENIRPEPALRLAVFLHDIGKPSCFTVDEIGVGHFYGHAKRSVEIASEVLGYLFIDRATRERVLMLVNWHDYWIEPQRKSIKRALARLTPGGLFELLEVKRADNLAQHPDCHDRIKIYEEIQKIAGEILVEKECFSLRDLAINGKDLILLGASPGKKIGDVLSGLLDGVIEGNYENKRDILLTEAGKLIQKK